MSAPTLDRRPGTDVPAPAGGSGASRPARSGVRGRADARRTLLVAAGALLGLVPLKAVFSDWTWLLEVIAFTALLMGPAALWRLRRRPAAWQLLPGLVLAAAFWWLLYLDPGASGLGPVELVRALHTQAADLVRTSGTPLDSTVALRMEVVPGLALVCAVIDWAAVVRRAPALAGIPLLAVFTTAGAVAGSVHWWQFAAAAGGYLLMLAADSRDVLLRWGRLVPRRRGDTLARPSLGLSGRRIGIIAVIVAVLLPLAIPGLSRNLLSEALNGREGTGSGNGNGTALSPLASLKGQLKRADKINLFSVRLSGTTSAYYLRSKVLERYTPAGWVAGPNTGNASITSAELARLGPLGGTRNEYTATVDIDNLNDSGAPVFAAPTALSGLGGWSLAVQQGVLVDNRTTSSTQYTEQVSEPAATETQLQAATGPVTSLPTQLRALPTDFPDEVRKIVTTETAGKTTPYGKALALLNFFRDGTKGFTYSLETSAGDSDSDLVDFLKNRQGYCQQYAAAMAVMLRAVNIPSRVVLGYTHANPDSDGRFTVTNHDSHAWVEAYFAGIGWYPFDPTPLSGSDAGRVQAPSNAPTPGVPTDGGGGSQPTGPTEPTRPTTSGQQRPEQTESSQIAVAVSDGSGGVPGWVLPTAAAVAAAVLLVLLAPGLRLAARRRRFDSAARHGRVEPLWQELHAAAADLGLAWTPATTPRQVVPWLAGKGAPADGLGRLARAVERERYGTGAVSGGAVSGGAVSDGAVGPSAEEVVAGRQRVTAVSRGLRAATPRWRRVRAVLLPASLRMTFGRRGPRSASSTDQ